MGSFGTRLSEFRKTHAKLNQEPFGAKAGLSQANITQWETGRGKPDAENMQKLSNAYPDLNIDWLLYGTGNMLNTKNTKNEGKVISFTQPYSKQQSTKKNNHKLAVLPMNALAGYTETVSDVEIDQNSIEFAVLPDYNHCDTIVEVDGDSMYPTFCSRDKVICKKLTDWEFIEAGKAYVINVKGQFVIKRVFEDPLFEFLVLVSDNDRNYPRQQIKKEWIYGMFKVHGVISNNTGLRKVA